MEKILKRGARMLKTEVKRHGTSIITVWYAKEALKQKGIICYREAQFKEPGKVTQFDTLITDLTQSEEEIVGKISKNGRYEIRRAAKEEVTARMMTGANVTDKIIREFCDFFVEFWKSKGVTYTEHDALYEEIKAYAAKEAFAVSVAEIKGKPYIYHTYLLDEEKVRLYHSASLYRVDEEIPHSLVGMANRYLHKEDMMYFKKDGRTVYDWGGAGESEDVKSITEFKKSFGADAAVYYDFNRVNGIWAKLVTKASQIKDIIRH